MVFSIKSFFNLSPTGSRKKIYSDLLVSRQERQHIQVGGNPDAAKDDPDIETPLPGTNRPGHD
jgi:hypothetical protein